MKSNQSTNFLLYLCAAIFIFWIGTQFGKSQLSYNGSLVQAFKSDSSNKDFDINQLLETVKKIDEKYVDKKKIDKKKMLYAAIKGMVGTLNDPYTYFLTPDENKQLKNELAGKLEGIGAMLEMKDTNITIISLLKNSPAEDAGLKPGDIISKVNNTSMKGQILTKVVAQIRGPKGTKVNLVVVRDGKEIPYTITRDQIQTNSLDLSYETAANCQSNCQKIALLQLHQFGDTSNDEWDTAVEEVKQKYENKEISGVVLDLRNNPGGYLQSAVYLTSDFIDKDKVIVTQESTNSSIPYYSLPSGRLKDIPLTVIVNQYSASAAEIMSGALKDYKRAVLVGVKTFGKGSVQEAVDLRESAGLHVTVAKWILPKGVWINGKGIEPNVKVESAFKENDSYSKEKDAQLQKAIDLVIK